MRVTRIIVGAATAVLALMSTVTHADDAEQAIRKSLQAVQLGVPIDTITASPLKDLYEVHLEGGRVLYASGDGQFLMQGNLFQMTAGQPVNLTEKAERSGIAKTINAIPEAEMVVYPAVGEAKTHITVFTDTTCPYCHKLHAEVAELNKRGVEVRYLAFPRQGPGSAGDKQLQAVWCSANRTKAMDLMVEGQNISAPECSNPVSKQYLLGQSIGVNGTPAIVLADGQLIPGYQPAAQVAKLALSAK